MKAGRSALKQAERRLPPDVRRRIDTAIKDGQKRFDATVKDIRARVAKADGRADLDRAIKRFDEFVKQARKMAGDAASAARAARRSVGTTTATRRTPTRRTSTRRPSARKPATRKAATRKAATRKAAPRRATARKPAARKTSSARASSRRTAAPAPATVTTARKPATRRAAPRRRATPASLAPAPEPTIRYVPPSVPEAPGPVPERVDWPGGSGS